MSRYDSDPEDRPTRAEAERDARLGYHDPHTHFLVDGPPSDPRTLCGLTLTPPGSPVWGGGRWAIVDAERRASCPTCVGAHQGEGWTFPLPALVAMP